MVTLEVHIGEARSNRSIESRFFIGRFYGFWVYWIFLYNFSFLSSSFSFFTFSFYADVQRHVFDDVSAFLMSCPGSKLNKKRAVQDRDVAKSDKKGSDDCVFSRQSIHYSY